jgi:small subunit ribosomal protein S17e
MNRVARLGNLLLERFGDRFTTDFERNKRVLAEVAVIRSKQLRNELAGYITKQVARLRAEAQEQPVVLETQAQS